jgi:hypothetical protein
LKPLFLADKKPQVDDTNPWSTQTLPSIGFWNSENTLYVISLSQRFSIDPRDSEEVLETKKQTPKGPIVKKLLSGQRADGGFTGR